MFNFLNFFPLSIVISNAGKIIIMYLTHKALFNLEMSYVLLKEMQPVNEGRWQGGCLEPRIANHWVNLFWASLIHDSEDG